MLDGALVLSLYDPSEKATQQRLAGVEAVTTLLSRGLSR
jgi:hypothetical protein